MLHGQTSNVGNFIVGEVKKIRSDKLHHPPYSFTSKYLLHCINDQYKCISLILLWNGIPYISSRNISDKKKRSNCSMTFPLY